MISYGGVSQNLLVIHGSVDSVETGRRRDDQSCRQIRLSCSNNLDDLRDDTFTVLSNLGMVISSNSVEDTAKQVLRYRISSNSKRRLFRAYLRANCSSCFSVLHQPLPCFLHILNLPV